MLVTQRFVFGGICFDLSAIQADTVPSFSMFIWRAIIKI